MSDREQKSLARNLGSFFGHIIRAIKTDPAEKQSERKIVRQQTEEEDRGDMIIRRTTIEEVEIKRREEDESADDAESEHGEIRET